MELKAARGTFQTAVRLCLGPRRRVDGRGSVKFTHEQHSLENVLGYTGISDLCGVLVNLSDAHSGTVEYQ